MGRVVDRVGEISEDYYGNKIIVIKYKKYDDIDVLFTEYNYTLENCSYKTFLSKGLKYPYQKSVCNIGYMGVGRYKTSNKHGTSKYYTTWKNLFTRCYGCDIKSKDRSYHDVEICDEWHNFQNFAKWYEDNYYEVNGEKMCLDKDILVKGNKMYSPDTCVFVPERINNIFINRSSKRGNTPMGVYYKMKLNKYESYTNMNGKREYLGVYDTIEDAFNVVKQSKEKYIKEVADMYENKIPKNLYDAMYSYKIEITD